MVYSTKLNFTPRTNAYRHIVSIKSFAKLINSFIILSKNTVLVNSSFTFTKFLNLFFTFRASIFILILVKIIVNGIENISFISVYFFLTIDTIFFHIIIILSSTDKRKIKRNFERLFKRMIEIILYIFG